MRTRRTQTKTIKQIHTNSSLLLVLRKLNRDNFARSSGIFSNATLTNPLSTSIAHINVTEIVPNSQHFTINCWVLSN